MTNIDSKINRSNAQDHLTRCLFDFFFEMATNGDLRTRRSKNRRKMKGIFVGDRQQQAVLLQGSTGQKILTGKCRTKMLLVRETDRIIQSDYIRKEAGYFKHSSHVFRRDLIISHFIPEIRSLKRCKTACLSRVSRQDLGPDL